MSCGTLAAVVQMAAASPIAVTKVLMSFPASHGQQKSPLQIV
jgi:hypothetical protein